MGFRDEERAEIIAILRKFSYKNWRLQILDATPYDHAVNCRWHYRATCSRTGEPIVINGPVPPIPYGVDREYIWHTVRESIHMSECHEADEFIRYNGEMIFDPHRGETPS